MVKKTTTPKNSVKKTTTPKPVVEKLDLSTLTDDQITQKAVDLEIIALPEDTRETLTAKIEEKLEELKLSGDGDDQEEDEAPKWSEEMELENDTVLDGKLYPAGTYVFNQDQINRLKAFQKKEVKE